MFREFFWTWGPWIYNITAHVMNRGKHLVRVIYNECVLDKEWIFLKNIPVPISSESFGQIQDIRVKWRCKLDPPQFLQPGFNSKEKHISYLGFIVKIPGFPNIDLTEWINDVHYIGTDQPTTGDIFALWCCENCVSYFHLFDVIRIECITDTGDTVMKGLNE